VRGRPAPHPPQAKERRGSDDVRASATSPPPSASPTPGRVRRGCRRTRRSSSPRRSRRWPPCRRPRCRVRTRASRSRNAANGPTR